MNSRSKPKIHGLGKDLTFKECFDSSYVKVLKALGSEKRGITVHFRTLFTHFKNIN